MSQKLPTTTASQAPVVQTDNSRAFKKKYLRPELKTYGKVHLATHGGSGSVGEGGGMNMQASDRSLKTNIVKVGSHPLGFGLYLFDYLDAGRPGCASGRRFGVMADEVQAVRPGAVSRRSDGYLAVNYGMIGIELAG